jgi:hypothetical protein
MPDGNKITVLFCFLRVVRGEQVMKDAEKGQQSREEDRTRKKTGKREILVEQQKKDTGSTREIDKKQN